jgi:adenylylsulfate kinase
VNKNIFLQNSLVNKSERSAQAGHRSVILWFTGLSGAGKSTLAHALEKALFDMGCRTFVIDGDNVRHGLCQDLGFSIADRQENIRRVGELAKLLVEAGVITLSAFISPFQDDRNRVRKLVDKEEFIEIYCNADLEVCEQRDLKGLYAKARKGEITDFTGISSPYEPPLHPDLVINSAIESLEQSVNRVVDYLSAKGIVSLKR